MNVTSLNIFFHNNEGVNIAERLNVSRAPGKTLCYRTLPTTNDPRWLDVHGIVTYSCDSKIREAILFDRDEARNPSEPCVDKLHYLIHFPKDPKCSICQRCKATQAPNYAKKNYRGILGWTEPKEFGDLGTVDHKTIAEQKPQFQDRSGEKYAVIM